MAAYKTLRWFCVRFYNQPPLYKLNGIFHLEKQFLIFLRQIKILPIFAKISENLRILVEIENKFLDRNFRRLEFIYNIF